MTPDRTRIKALVLAGERTGPNPLLEAEDAPNKAEILINGQPMIDRVLASLTTSGLASPVYVAGAHETTRARLAGGAFADAVAHLASAPGPAATVMDALQAIEHYPVLITTSDHPLLTPAMVATFVEASLASGADLTLGLASRETIEARYPKASRTYFPVGGQKVSGCNLFLALTPAALNIVRFWIEAEADRKRPARIAARFGLLNAMRILRPGMSFDGVFRVLSRRLGCVVRPVMMPVAEAAIDVDKPDDLALVREILSAEVA